MFVVIDSSTLIAASVLWIYESEDGKYKLKHKHQEVSMNLFEFLKKNKEIKCIITKTIENEAQNVLIKAVGDTLEFYINKERLPYHIIKKMNFMTLQDIINNESMDRMENLIEEYSMRLKMDIEKRDMIKEKEIIPFFDEMIPKTKTFLQAPFIPKTVKGSKSNQEDILKNMSESLLKDNKVIIYKGYPESMDLILMSEAVFIKRNHCKEDDMVYIASIDNHFKPNPIFVGCPTWKLRNKIKDKIKIDSTIRDMMYEKFGFKGEHPIQLLEVIGNDIKY